MAEKTTTLSDDELIEACNDWVSRLAKSGGRDWCLSVPVNFNKDPDMLFIELGKRLAAGKEELKRYAWIDATIPPDNDWWKQVLIDGKHWTFPCHYVAGKWYESGSPKPISNVTHYRDFTDL